MLPIPGQFWFWTVAETTYNAQIAQFDLVMIFFDKIDKNLQEHLFFFSIRLLVKKLPGEIIARILCFCLVKSYSCSCKNKHHILYLKEGFIFVLSIILFVDQLERP